ncbi:hypothetical protein TNCV_861761 [Trichonephila clavipes]|nr:hypothetical protein TNCV_861761 [Trichonephila clavipes]
MLDFIYGDVFFIIDLDSCLSLYASAHKYGLPLLKVKCYNYLKDDMSHRKCSKLLDLAEDLNDSDLIPLLQEYTSKTFPGKEFLELHHQEMFM